MLAHRLTTALGVLPILLAGALAQQAQGQNAHPVAGTGPAEEIAVVAENAAPTEPARVRIGLKLTPFKKVVKQHADGRSNVSFVALEPLRHTLRARLDKPNHFFVGDYHVESEPKKWQRGSKRYEVRLKISRRYGAHGQLEENVGELTVAGTLEADTSAGGANVHLLRGVARRRLRDKFQHPVVDVVAGFAPAALAKGKAPMRPSTTQPAKASAPAGETLQRERF